MSFGNSPKDNQNTPTSSVYVPGTANSDFTALRGMNSTTDSNSQKSAAASMGIEDGANISQGALADVAVTGDNAGSLSAKLRGLSKIWFDMWDSTNHWLQVKVMNATPLGQTTKINSSPVALPSDQVSAGVSDGVLPSNLLEQALALYSGGGQVDSSGKSVQAAFDRLKSLQGSGVQSGTITATVAGDMALAFSVAPKTIMPGQRIRLRNGATVEWVIVSTSYTPSSTATSIPLQYPVVNAGITAASWDVFAGFGPDGTSILEDGIGVFALATQDSVGNAQTYIASNGGGGDGRPPFFFLQTINGLLNSANTIDQMRGNLDNITLLASAARTATTQSSDQTNYNGRGVIVVLNMSNAGTGSVTLEIDGKDPVSGQYYALLTGVAVTANSVNVYTVYPGLSATANVSANSPLPRTWRVKVVANNATSATYSVGASVIV